MTTIRQLLKTKGNDIWTVAPESTVFDALKLMAEKNVGALLVTENDALVGIVSERDYARKGILKGLASEDTRVSEIMVTRVVFAKPEESIEQCMALMSSKHIRHLPVMEDGKLVGIVSIGDLVLSIISDQKFMIDQLEKYITG